MPRHWKQPLEFEAGKPMEDPAWVGVRDWSAGQAVQLRAALERSRGAAKGERYDKKDVWPEYGELSCFACHHSLGPAKDSWRQKYEYTGRGRAIRRGMNRALSCFAWWPKKWNPAAAQELERNLKAVSSEMSKLNPDKSVVIAAAGAAAPVAQHLADRLSACNTTPHSRFAPCRKLRKTPKQFPWRTNAPQNKLHGSRFALHRVQQRSKARERRRSSRRHQRSFPATRSALRVRR